MSEIGKAIGKARVLNLGEFKRAEKAALVVNHPTRNHLILYLSFGLGLRACEMRQLRVGDVFDSAGNLFDVVTLTKTKNNKKREVFLSNKKIKLLLLKHYEELKQRCEKKRIPFNAKTVLIMSQKGGEFRPNHIVALMCSFFKTAGIEGARSHSGRHTLITKLIDDGYDIASIARLMGHSDVNTTMGYIHSNRTRLMKISEKSIF